MGEIVAERFEFEKRYGISRSSAINKAMGMIYAGVPRRFVILKVNAEEKQLALDMANFCVEALQRFNEELSISSSKSWVIVLDRPELSIHLSSRKQQKRNLVINSLTGLVIGFAIALTKNSFYKLIKEALNPA
jgi:capsular polysaccharide biosynthesis protein